MESGRAGSSTEAAENSLLPLSCGTMMRWEQHLPEFTDPSIPLLGTGDINHFMCIPNHCAWYNLPRKFSLQPCQKEWDGHDTSSHGSDIPWQSHMQPLYHRWFLPRPAVLLAHWQGDGVLAALATQQRLFHFYRAGSTEHDPQQQCTRLQASCSLLPHGTSLNFSQEDMNFAPESLRADQHWQSSTGGERHNRLPKLLSFPWLSGDGPLFRPLSGGGDAPPSLVHCLTTGFADRSAPWAYPLHLGTLGEVKGVIVSPSHRLPIVYAQAMHRHYRGRAKRY